MWGFVKPRHLEKSREMSVLNLSLPNYTKLGTSNFIPGCSKLHVDETFCNCDSFDSVWKGFRMIRQLTSKQNMNRFLFHEIQS